MNPRTACLAPEYDDRNGSPPNAIPEHVLMIVPASRATIRRSATRTPLTVPRYVTSVTRRNSSASDILEPPIHPVTRAIHPNVDRP